MRPLNTSEMNLVDSGGELGFELRADVRTPARHDSGATELEC